MPSSTTQNPGISNSVFALALWNGIDSPTALYQTEDRYLPGGTPTSLSIAPTAKIATVHFHFPE